MHCLDKSMLVCNILFLDTSMILRVEGFWDQRILELVFTVCEWKHSFAISVTWSNENTKAKL